MKLTLVFWLAFVNLWCLVGAVRGFSGFRCFWWIWLFCVVWVCGFVSLVLILFVKVGLVVWVWVVDITVFVIFEFDLLWFWDLCKP